MTAIFFDVLPENAEFQKEKRPNSYTIMGVEVFASEMFNAILRYSRCDRILVPLSPKPAEGDIRDSDLYFRNRDRIELVTEQQIVELKLSAEYNRLIFMTRATDLASMARLRRISGCHRSPIVGVIHSINYSWQLRIVMMLLISGLNSFDAVVCSSTAGKTAMTRFIDLLARRLDMCGLPAFHAEFKMPLIPLGVDTDQFAKTQDANVRQDLHLSDQPVILYFGRFSPTSKADLLPLILAFRQITETHPTVTLILAGDDTHHNMSDQMLQLAGQLKIDRNVRVIPNPDLHMKLRLYAASDIFVSPSDSLQETFGITVVEAMAAGLPCVVSDWDGYKDIIVDGQTGFRIPTTLPVYPLSFDDLRGSGEMKNVDLLAGTTIVKWQEFVARVSDLLFNRDLRKRMGRAARLRATALYDWRVVIRAHDTLWETLLAEAATLDGIPAHPSLELDSFGYKDIFSHYSTDQLSGDRILSISKSSLRKLIPLRVLRETLPWLQEDIFLSIMRIMEDIGTTTVDEMLLALGSNSEEQVISNIAHLCRLIKYGFIDICT